MCESVVHTQRAGASGKLACIHKVLSLVYDYALKFEVLQYNYDWWLFKTITGAINSSRASGCSPNTRLQDKSLLATYWQWQHLYLTDAVRQYGFPSFLSITHFEWTFPWPPFVDKMRVRYGRGPTDCPFLETLHIAHVLEQIMRCSLV